MGEVVVFFYLSNRSLTLSAGFLFSDNTGYNTIAEHNIKNCIEKLFMWGV